MLGMAVFYPRLAALYFKGVWKVTLLHTTHQPVKNSGGITLKPVLPLAQEPLKLMVNSTSLLLQVGVRPTP